jgi:hypothetical protein
MYAHCGYSLLWSVHPLPVSPFPFKLPPPIFQQLSIHVIVSSTFTSYVVLLMLHHSFPFSLSPSSVESFHCYKHVLHLSLYMIMLVSVYMFIFGSIFHIWEKSCGLCLSEPGLLHLKWCPPCFVFIFTSIFSSIHSLWFLHAFTNSRICSFTYEPFLLFMYY